MKKAMILTFSKVYNRGANMQCYALMKTLEKKGYNVEFIDAQLPREKKSLKGFLFYWLSYYKVAAFRRKTGFKYTRKYQTYNDLCNNPPKADVYIVGSDQVWNPELTNAFDPRVYFLGYIKEGKKIAYAASFGKNEWTSTIYDKEIIENVSLFNAVSVREDSGIDICRNTFKRNDAAYVLDPTLLLDGNDIRSLIKENKTDKNNEYMYVYLLYTDEKVRNIIDIISKECKLKAKGNTTQKGLLNKLLSIESVEGWLREIENAKLVVTNSFHCMAMCILFHKPFYVIPTFKGREIRMTTLLDKLGIKDRYIPSVETKYLCANQDIDFGEVDKRLDYYREISQDFLNKSL